MGMMIDDARRELISDEPYTDKFATALVVAIDTMRKYQKIEEIVKAWNDMNSFDSMVQISEVLEDGKDN